MNFGKTILVPSFSRKPDFDSVASLGRTFRFACVKCSSMITRDFDSFIGLEFGWREKYDKDSLAAIEKHFGLNIVGKSPDGGWTAVCECNCENCGTLYLLYAGVEEYSNSAHRVTLQGITEIYR